MFKNPALLPRLGLVGLAFVLSLLIVACNSSEQPKPTIDTTSGPKPTETPTANPVAPTGTATNNK